MLNEMHFGGGAEWCGDQPCDPMTQPTQSQSGTDRWAGTRGHERKCRFE